MPAWLTFGGLVILGIVLGIVLERGRFCFVTAFQETMEFHNPWILRGVIFSMGLLALATGILSQFGLLHPALVNQGWYTVLGGLLFGTGIAMCGACATGQLFRAGAGYIANWMEFIGAGLGALLYAVVWWGPVEKPALAASHPISLLKVFGIPPILWGLLVGIAFIALAQYLRRFLPQLKSQTYREKRFTFSLKKPWHPYAAGVGLAVVTILYALLTKGSSMSVMSPNALSVAWPLNQVTQLFGLNLATLPWYRDPGRWHPSLVGLGVVLFIPLAIVGAHFSSRLAGEFRLRMPAKRSKLLWYLVGGIIMGFGARMALGCNVGSWYDSLAFRFDLSGLLFSAGLFPGVWFGTRLDEWVAERIWGFGAGSAGVIAPARLSRDSLAE